MIALSWSGGKDCAVALEELRASGRGPDLLLTTTDESTREGTHHGIPAEILRRQAQAAGLPLVEIPVPRAGGDAYAARMRSAFASPPLAGAEAVAFGDLFLEDLRELRSRRLREVGVEALFPLWGRPTDQLAAEVIERGYQAIVVAIDPAVLPASALGRGFDRVFIDGLPEGVDPCGENGEFHTFVHAGPCFGAAVAHRRGETCSRDGFPTLQLLAV